jgi:hypothetical protein
MKPKSPDIETMIDEINAANAGQNIDEYRAEKELHLRILQESKKYVSKPFSEWPAIEFNWDVSRKGQRYSLDGVHAELFEETYPEGFLLGFVNLRDFDTKLCHYSRRDEGELWSVGCESKLAKLIVYLSENRKISPPLVKPLETGEVIFQGGHHRYAIAKENGEIRIPIYVQPEYKPVIDKIFSIEWEDA